MGKCSLSYESIGTTHGFAARPNLAYPDVKEAYEQCLVQAIDWFKKTLV